MMKPRLTTNALSLVLKIYEAGSASLGLLVGVYMACELVRLARIGANASFGGAELPPISE
jgi:hypothetical protein